MLVISQSLFLTLSDQSLRNLLFLIFEQAWSPLS